MSSTQSTGLIEARLELAGHNEESVFIALEAIPRRGLGEAIHLGFGVFLAVLGVLHHVGESHQRLVGAAHRVQRGIHRQLVALGLIADVPLPLGAANGAAGHHHFQRLRVPLGPQLDQRVEEIHADAAAHADDHRLAVHRLDPLFEMQHQIGGEEWWLNEALPLGSLLIQNQNHLFRVLSGRTPSFISAAIACSA